jgi:hypothetical protein
LTPDTGVLITRFLVGGIGSTRWTPLQIGGFLTAVPLETLERHGDAIRYMRPDFIESIAESVT